MSERYLGYLTRRLHQLVEMLQQAKLSFYLFIYLRLPFRNVCFASEISVWTAFGDDIIQLCADLLLQIPAVSSIGPMQTVEAVNDHLTPCRLLGYKRIEVHCIQIKLSTTCNFPWRETHVLYLVWFCSAVSHKYVSWRWQRGALSDSVCM